MLFETIFFRTVFIGCDDFVAAIVKNFGFDKKKAETAGKENGGQDLA